MEPDEFADYDVHQLVGLVHEIGTRDPRSARFESVLTVLFHRLSDEPTLKRKPGRAKIMIDHLRRIYSGDDGPDPGGVREPRRRPPDAGTGFVKRAD